MVEPGAVNVVPGSARLCIDVRHANDEARTAAVAEIRARAVRLAARRGVAFCDRSRKSIIGPSRLIRD